MKIEDQIATLADEFLERLVFNPIKQTHPAAHENLWQVDYHAYHGLQDKVADDVAVLIDDEHHEATRIAWPVDTATATWKEDHIFLDRVSTVAPKDVRGLVRVVPQKMVSLTAGWLFPDRLEADRTVFGLVGGVWRNVQLGSFAGFARVPDPQLDLEGAMTIHMTISALLTERYYWHVALGFHDGPRLVLKTNSGGCAAIFRSRDAAVGSSRRAALRNWVRNHYRDNSGDPGALIYVRDHLRGRTEFQWNGLDCEVMVSAFDLERNEAFAHETAQWRTQRKHNRVNLRVKNLRKTAII